MMIKEIATIPFADGESGDDGIAVIRQCDEQVALAFSLQSNGDLEVSIDVNTARKLADALNHAIDLIHIESNRQKLASTHRGDD